MCGIAGSVSERNEIDRKVLDNLQHRGPDDQTFLKQGNVTLYHTRLAIQDLCNGAQPMNLGDKLSIVFNGEIYNHEELRVKHILKCNTRSDTETILHLYNKLGITFLNELDGMFAIALLDKSAKKLWLIRDRAGKKPLYYTHKDKEWFFASELNVIANAKAVEINNQCFYEYLRIGSYYRSHTPYKDVCELPAGSILEINLPENTFTLKKWWTIVPFYQRKLQIDEHSALSQLERFFDLAVQRRLESSDLEVGCFLSGGIDSSLVATTAAKYKSQIKTFTVAFSGKYDESPLARLVSNQIGSKHHEIHIDFRDLKYNIEKIISNYGEPFMDVSAIPTWYVSKEAKKYVNVILNGDGADELFGGYRRYVPFSKYDFFNASYPVCAAANIVNSVLPLSHDKLSVYNYLYRLTALAKKDPLDVYLSATVDILEGLPKTIFKDKASAALNEISNEVKEYVSGVDTGLRKIMLLDFDISLLGQLLVKIDIGSMAHALECRSPFLSKELLEWAPSLPDDLKIKGKTTKYLLRQYAKDKIPGELIMQPKRGFEIPLKQWVEGDLKELIYSYIFSSNALFTNYIDKTFVINLFNKKIKVGDEKRAKILWTIFSSEVWFKNIYHP